MTSKYERQFRTRYPHARTFSEPAGFHGGVRTTILAGDYPCAQALTVAQAFKLALEYDDAGILQADPAEEATCE